MRCDYLIVSVFQNHLLPLVEVLHALLPSHELKLHISNDEMV